MQAASSPAANQLTLHEWACLRTELIFVYDQPVPADAKLTDGDYRNKNCLWYLRKGWCEVTSKATVYRIRAGMWLMLPKDECRQKFSDDAHILSIHFICQWPSGESVLNEKKGLIVKGGDYPELERNANRLEQLVRSYFPLVGHDHHAIHQLADYRHFLELQSLFFDLLSSWFCIRVEHGATPTRVQGGNDRPMQAARRLNEASLDRGSPKIWLYREIGLSESYLNRIFLKEFGVTPQKYWERRRLEFVKRCLESGDTPIKEIAYRVGFRSDSHFVAWFRRLAHTSPGVYRRRYVPGAP